MPSRISGLNTQHGTSADWRQRFFGEGIEPAISVEGYKTADKALEQVVHYDLLIVDAPTRASDRMQKIAERASFVVQRTDPTLDDLGPAVRLFDELIKTGIPRARVIFSLKHVLTDVEEQAARKYLREAGYEVLSGFLPAKTSHRDARNRGRSETETRDDSLNAEADPAIALMREP